MKFTLEIDCTQMSNLDALRMVIHDCAHRIVNPPDTIATPIHEDRLQMFYNGQRVGLAMVAQPAAPQEGSINPEYHECDEDIESGLCRICHVEMTAPCPTCGGCGYHVQPCAALPSR